LYFVEQTMRKFVGNSTKCKICMWHSLG
jgi:hypothetical protein